MKNHLLIFLLCFAGFLSQGQSVGGSISGATLLCPGNINSGFLTLSGYTGTILYWESSTNGGASWNNIGNPTPSYSYSNITQTTCYRAIVQAPTFPPDTSTEACLTVYAPSVGGTLSTGGEFCDSTGTGTLNLTGNTGNVLLWEYSTNGGATWTPVANTTTVLIHPNITQNTIYQAIVQNGPTCPTDTSSQVIFVIDPITVAGTISGKDTVCYAANSGTLNLSGNVGNVLKWLSSTNNGINWIPISNTTASQSYSGLTQTTWYAAVVQSGICKMDTTPLTQITVWIPSPVHAGTDTTITKGQSFSLNGTGTGKPLWIPSAGLNKDTVFKPIATPSTTTTYVLAVTDIHGCINSDTIIVTVIDGEFSAVIPNLITPNGDGINDAWHLPNIEEFPDNEVFIYNIYGNEVYHKKNYANDWKGTYNGSDLPDGTYYYVLKFNDSSETFKGSLDILRSK